jgi:hypothetical protein
MPVVTAVMTAVVTRFGRRQWIALAMSAPAMAPAGFRSFRHTVQTDTDVGPATARARTRPDDRSRATTTLAALAGEGYLSALANRIRATTSATAAPGLSDSGHGIVATTTTPSTSGFGSRSGIASTAPTPSRSFCHATSPTGTLGMRFTTPKGSPTSGNHPSGGALLRRCTMLSTLASSFCHWCLRAHVSRRRFENLTLTSSGA